MPITIKDNLDTGGTISTGGTKGRKAFVPAHDATVVTRLRGAGAIPLGKSNMPELTMAYEAENLAVMNHRRKHEQRPWLASKLFV